MTFVQNLHAVSVTPAPDPAHSTRVKGSQTRDTDSGTLGPSSGARRGHHSVTTSAARLRDTAPRTDWLVGAGCGARLNVKTESVRSIGEVGRTHD